MKILIFGANGMIGHKMYFYLNNFNYDIWATCRTKLNNINGNKLFNANKIIENVDLTNIDIVYSILNKLKPDIIINAAGITIRRGIEKDISDSILVNSVLPHVLKKWVEINSFSRLIHFSTDCVFSGLKGNYKENSTLDAIDIYGKSKGLGEVYGSRILTLRSSMIGRELDYYTELFEWLLSNKDKTINGYSNVMYSGITTIRMAFYVKLIIDNHINMNGIYNVSSIPISKYELLTKIEKKFKLNINVIKKDDYISNKILDSTLFFDYLNIQKPSWQELIDELHQDCLLNINLYKN